MENTGHHIQNSLKTSDAAASGQGAIWPGGLIFGLIGTSQSGWVAGRVCKMLACTYDDLSPVSETLHEKAHVWWCSCKPTAKDIDTGRPVELTDQLALVYSVSSRLMRDPASKIHDST